MKHQWLKFAKHEAGHHVVARALGFGTGEITMIAVGQKADEGSATAAIILNEQLSDVDAIVDYCERRVLVLCAGAIAEALSAGKSDQDKANAAWKSTAVSDWEKCKEILHVLYNIKLAAKPIDMLDQDYLDKLANELVARASNLVEANAAVIEEIGAALLEKVVLVGMPGTLAKDELEKFIVQKVD